MIDSASIPWTEKYRARNLSEIKGQDVAVEKVRLFLRQFPKKKAVVLHGPPGVGKTSIAYAIARELDSEVLELNASDLRNKTKIAAIIGPASQQKSLFKASKVILVDEVDGVSAIKDRGGLGELLSLIEKSSFPIIITANDIWQKKFNLLRQKCEVVGLKEIHYKIILEILRGVLAHERMTLSTEVLTSVAIRSKGDIRAALNDLYILSTTDSTDLLDELGERNKEQSIFSALQFVFKNVSVNEEMLRVFDEVAMSVDEIFLWMEENIPLEYKGEELFKAFEALAIADVYRGRIMRQRHYRFMMYETFFLGAGVATAKKYNRTGWTSYKKPTRILKIWLQNQRAAKKKSICQKYARACHISLKTAMKDWLLLKQILEKQSVHSALRLTPEEITYLQTH